MDDNQGGRFTLRLGRFGDAAAERSFREYELDSGYRSLSLVLPLLGLVFLGFSVPDALALGLSGVGLGLFAMRAAFCAVALVAPLFLRPGAPLRRRELTLGAVTLGGVAAFGLAVFAYRNLNFYLQAMSVLLMIGAHHLIPNRLSISIATSIAIAALGVLSFAARAEPFPASTASAFVVDFFLMALLSSIVQLRTCRARRREFAKAMELERISKTDPLTGLGNRRYLAERFAEASARLARYGEPYALVLVDLDRFKALNDDFGHEAGDEALKETAARLSSALRQEDALSRWGGEEFVALLSNASPLAARESASRLKAALSSRPMPLVGTVYASFGVTMLRPGEALDDAVARADVALYRAKDSGRDRVEFEP